MLSRKEQLKVFFNDIEKVKQSSFSEFNQAVIEANALKLISLTNLLNCIENNEKNGKQKIVFLQELINVEKKPKENPKEKPKEKQATIEQMKVKLENLKKITWKIEDEEDKKPLEEKTIKEIKDELKAVADNYAKSIQSYGTLFHRGGVDKATKFKNSIDQANTRVDIKRKIYDFIDINGGYSKDSFNTLLLIEIGKSQLFRRLLCAEIRGISLSEGTLSQKQGIKDATLALHSALESTLGIKKSAPTIFHPRFPGIH